MKKYNVIIKEELNQILLNHLIRSDGQEDLCFATYNPSSGSETLTGILSSIILPYDSERNIHGNVGFLPSYLERVIQIAIKQNEGMAFIHSHPSHGWQDMSSDDIAAEKKLSPTVMAITNLPLLGLTVGSDGEWSARFWEKDINVKRKYDRYWCSKVKVLGSQLKICFNDNIELPNFDVTKQLRTISAWGKKSQEDLSRLHIGIVGLGSVGSIVAEILARTGISNITLIDFDEVEAKNLDRLTNVFVNDIGKSKVQVIKERILNSATSPNIDIKAIEYSICEKEGFMAALNCDILFSCVDRPWPREILNFLAYAHLIPVIDGGILVRTNKDNTKIVGADWKAQTVGYTRPCLKCLGQYQEVKAGLEREGHIDNPSYLKGIQDISSFESHENVFTFSSHLASMEVLQLLNLFLAPSGISNVGQQIHHFVIGDLTKETSKECHDNCYFQTIIGKGDYSGVVIYGKHDTAEKMRLRRHTIYKEPIKKNIFSQIQFWFKRLFFYI